MTRFHILLLAGLLAAGDVRAQEQVLPSAADPAVTQADDPSLVYEGKPQARPPLVVYLDGTGGLSEFAPRLLLQTIVQQGYRVIFLSYVDTPSASQVCPPRPRGCFARFRATRLFGGTGGPVRNTPADAIVPRLAALLRYLDHEHPGDGWNGYLAPDGAPAWPRIVVSGLSQGAGMAAFIAKLYPVERAVLFSSPWDEMGPDHRPAPWLSAPSTTPMDRWWAERHAREATTDWIANAYQALGLPADHILIFNGTPTGGARGRNPFHTTTVSLPDYVPQWRVLFGWATP